MKRKISKIMMVLTMISLVLITAGVTLAFYSYTRTGTTENVVTTGAINFIYTEIDGQGSGISITDAVPMSDNLGKEQSGDRNVFNYKIKSSNPTEKYINYTVTVRKRSTDTELDNYVKLNLKEIGGTYDKTNFYKDLKKYNNLDNERIIYQGEVTNANNYEKNFQLRMWLSDTLTIDENTNAKSFSLTVNVYAEGSEVASSANCGEAVCENKSFAQYMTAQDQAIVGQYIPLTPPTGGSVPDSFSGNQFNPDWKKAFVRPLEYGNQYYDVFGSIGYNLPDINNDATWNNFTIYDGTKNTSLPAYLDNIIYTNTGKHINLWIAEVAIAESTSHTTQIALAGLYTPSNIGWKINANYPNYGFAIVDYIPTGDIYLPSINTTYWNPSGVGLQKNWQKTGEFSGNFVKHMKTFTLVYSVDNFKSYLRSLSASNYISFMNSHAYILAECNIPEDY